MWFLGAIIGLIIGDFFMAGSWAIYGLFSYASYLVLPGKPEQLHFTGMMVWNGKSKALDFLFSLQPGSGAQEKGTVTVQSDGSILREIAMIAPDGDLDRFRQIFRKLAGGKAATRMMEQTATGWKLDPPGEIVMEKVPNGSEPASLAK